MQELIEWLIFGLVIWLFVWLGLIVLAVIANDRNKVHGTWTMFQNIIWSTAFVVWSLITGAIEFLLLLKLIHVI